MLLLVLLVLIYGYFAIRYGYQYAVGMAEYAKFNNVGRDKEYTWQSVINESYEFKQALSQGSVRDIILELSDVGHSLVKHVSISYLPAQMFCNKWYWLIIFVICLPLIFCTGKLATRYRHFGCIRNHRNPGNCGHKCNYKKVDY